MPHRIPARKPPPGSPINKRKGWFTQLELRAEWSYLSLADFCWCFAAVRCASKIATIVIAHWSLVKAYWHAKEPELRRQKPLSIKYAPSKHLSMQILVAIFAFWLGPVICVSLLVVVKITYLIYIYIYTYICPFQRTVWSCFFIFWWPKSKFMGTHRKQMAIFGGNKFLGKHYSIDLHILTIFFRKKHHDSATPWGLFLVLLAPPLLRLKHLINLGSEVKGGEFKPGFDPQKLGMWQ